MYESYARYRNANFYRWFSEILYGKYIGDYSKDKTLAVGSHTDSVRNGGQFDGPVRSIYGIKISRKF